MSERSYTTVDKSIWGPGPWQDEPDKMQRAMLADQMSAAPGVGPEVAAALANQQEARSDG